MEKPPVKAQKISDIKMVNQRQVKTFDHQFFISLGLFMLLVGVICFFPIWLTSSSNKFDFRETGEIGDTIGGTMGPFIAIAASILTFLAFWVQFKANQQQRYDIKLERFESKSYELIRLHRANIDEINLDGRVRGRSAFPQMLSELRYIDNKVSVNAIDVWLFSPDLDQDEMNLAYLNLAYKIFFFGIGFDSRLQIKDLITEDELETFGNVELELLDAQKRYQTFRNDDSNGPFVEGLDDNGLRQWSTLEINYTPFNGQSSWLGHYFRHLFQTVKFVDEQPDNFLSKQQKVWYLKTLRAQLSNEEQVLIYYNSLSDLGKEWHIQSYFQKYYLLKNMPLGRITMGVRPHLTIGMIDNQGNYYFEWDELQQTAKKSIEQLRNERSEELKKDQETPLADKFI